MMAVKDAAKTPKPAYAYEPIDAARDGDDDDESDQKESLAKVLLTNPCGAGLRRLHGITVGAIGISLVWSLQFALTVPYFEQLGTPRQWLSYIWLCGPVSGMVQAFVGAQSDRTGQRRSYIFCGAACAVSSLVLVGLSADLVAVLGAGRILVPLIGLWMLDIATNVLLVATRALLTDETASTGLLETGNALYTTWKFIGQSLGYGLVHSHLGTWVSTAACPIGMCADLRSAFLLGACIEATVVSITLVASSRHVEVRRRVGRRKRAGGSLETVALLLEESGAVASDGQAVQKVGGGGTASQSGNGSLRGGTSLAGDERTRVRSVGDGSERQATGSRGNVARAGSPALSVEDAEKGDSVAAVPLIPLQYSTGQILTASSSPPPSPDPIIRDDPAAEIDLSVKGGRHVEVSVVEVAAPGAASAPASPTSHRDVLATLLNLPASMRRVLAVQFCVWIAWFIFNLYITTWVGEHVFGADPVSDPERFAEGVRHGSLGLLVQGFVGFATSILIPHGILLFGSQGLWAIGNAILAVCMFSTALVDSPAAAIVLIAMTGIAFAIGLTLPYTLIGALADPTQRGLFMGVLNTFIVLPQLIVSLTTGPLIQWAFGGQITPAIAMGGSAALVASVVGFYTERQERARK